jgi:hypothetical protein
MNNNPYYSPECLNLTIIDSLDEDINWEFNIVLLWQHNETKELYWAQDSGCSCPTPFEDYNTLEDLNCLHKGNWNAFEQDVRGMNVSKGEKQQMLRKAVILLAEVTNEKNKG